MRTLTFSSSNVLPIAYTLTFLLLSILVKLLLRSMSTSEQQLLPPQAEESSFFKQEEDGDAKTRVFVAQEGVKEFEECKTPTGSGNKIPIIQSCPPAPRKKRRPMPTLSSSMKRSSSSGLSYVAKHDEVVSFFQSEMFKDLTRVNKKCRIV